MTLADLASSSPPEEKPGPRCTVCVTLAALPEDEAAAFRALLSNTAWSYRALHQALGHEGYNLSIHMLTNHARGLCAAGERLR